MSGQSIVDRLNAAKHTVAGSALGRAVVKATTEEIMGPKRKHLDYLLQCTSEINVSIPQMADLLIERTQNTSWVATFKSLITIHHLMCYGNERFSQYMASHNVKFSVNPQMAMMAAASPGMQGGADMCSYIRKYAHYLNEKRETYKLMGYDFCKVKRGKDDGMLRTMNTEKLLKALPVLAQQLDALLQFDVQANELTNGVISACFVLMSKDLIRLFACYNDGVINLLEKFFDMNKKNCREALDIYKKFIDRTDAVSHFLKVAESSGMDKSDIPDLTKAPSSLLEALEAHVNSLEGGAPNKPKMERPPPPANSAAAAAARQQQQQQQQQAAYAANLSNEEKRRVLEEEARAMEQFKANHIKKQGSTGTPTNGEHPFGKPSASADLFGELEWGGGAGAAAAAPPQPKAASDDLLMLGNPFAAPPAQQTNPFQQQQQQIPVFPSPMGGGPQFTQKAYFPPSPTSPYGVNPLAMQPPQQPPPYSSYTLYNPVVPPMMGGLRKADDLFSGIKFPATSSLNGAIVKGTEFDAFGDVLQPTQSSVLSPMATQAQASRPAVPEKPAEPAKILSNDLDSSLASLADNLDIKNKNFQQTKWAPNQQQQQGQQKTGGQNWTTTPMAAAWNPAVNPAAANSPWNMGGAAGAATNNPFAAQGQQQNKPATTSSTNPFAF